MIISSRDNSLARSRSQPRAVAPACQYTPPQQLVATQRFVPTLRSVCLVPFYDLIIPWTATLENVYNSRNFAQDPFTPHPLSLALQARTRVTLHTATDVCLPTGMRFAAPHSLRAFDTRQRLLTRLSWLVDMLLRVRRADSDLNPNHLLVPTVSCTMRSFAVMSPTSRSALVAWHCPSSGCLETTREREARGAGASARNGLSCACWGVKVLFEDHVDIPSVQQTLVIKEHSLVTVAT